MSKPKVSKQSLIDWSISLDGKNIGHITKEYIKGNSGAYTFKAKAFQFVDGKHGTMTRREILFHIVNHGTYHRGAIGHALDLAGVSHPADTYTVFIHSAQPVRREQI